ncbi:MAG: putative 4-hydroxybenzoate polyprenyltransferase [Prevotellaceae bacterium]|jgi:4-hydroxybenzoate polyprenyltransferase|nr:putative 4-hydroxybenzoate polyprenyltransferase [Prevotellaceae bacterium]
MSHIKNYASLVKISHTIFALPFAMIGYTLGVTQPGQIFQPLMLLFVVLCMFFARNAAMSFNRYADRKFDAANARTANREIPSGTVRPQHALAFCIVNAILFCATTLIISRLCFVLSPIALAVVLGYSYTKRFTALCHFILGLGLSLAPIGAYIAVTGAFTLTPLMFSVIVLLWSGGFDILYALPDEDFDKNTGLFSIPSAIGRHRALWLSSIVHVICAALVILVGYQAGFNVIYYIGAALFIGCLIYQHCIISSKDISRVNVAFAAVNGVASIIFSTFCTISLLW